VRKTSLEARALAVVVIVMALVAFLKPGSSSNEDPHEYRPSTFVNGKPGLCALYLALEELGYDVGRLMLPFSSFERTREPLGSLAIISPADPLTPAEADWLWSWVQEGGRLFYVPTMSGSDHFIECMGLDLVRRFDPLESRKGMATLAESEALDRLPPETREILDGSPRTIDGFNASFAFEDSRADASEVLYTTDRSRGAVAFLRAGEGRIALFSHPAPITNGRLRESGAAVLAVRAIADLSRDQTIWFDEFHHGFDERGSIAQGLSRFLTGTKAGWSVLQLGALGMLAILFAGIRLGSPVPPAPPSRRSSLEHVRALASAYLAAGTRNRAADLILEGLRLRVGARSQDDLNARLASLAAHDQRIAEALELVTRFREQKDLVPLSAAVDRLIAAIEGTESFESRAREARPVGRTALGPRS
jgi:hypothetical protein